MLVHGHHPQTLSSDRQVVQVHDVTRIVHPPESHVECFQFRNGNDKSVTNKIEIDDLSSVRCNEFVDLKIEFNVE